MNLKPTDQDQAWKRLLNIKDRLPACLILTGPSGVGKRQAIKALFQLMHCNHSADQLSSDLSEAACGECASCRKIAHGNHLDLIEIQADGENISVDKLREMKKNLFFSPIEGKTRFVIIDDAHKLNPTSANTLLKTLEEPPAHTRFFLITYQKNLLLPTILSRSQILFFNPLNDAVIRSHFLKQTSDDLPENLIHFVVACSNGGLDRIDFFKQEKTLEFLSQIISNHNTSADFFNEDWKSELFLDYLVYKFHRNVNSAVKENKSHLIFDLSELAFKAAFLRTRLSRAANKKLIALAANNLNGNGLEPTLALD